MPILHNNRPLFRIKFKDANIREVRRGNELEWGLYKIEYINGIPIELEKENITEYVWGYPGYLKEDFTLFLPEGYDSNGGVMAEEAGDAAGSEFAYKSKANGWYSDHDCLSFIPAITRDFHKDLKLFCKWTQRRYWFNGTYKWEDDQGGGSGSYPTAPERGTAATSLDSSYYYMGSDNIGECTWYAHGRAAEMRGNLGAAAPYGNGSAEGGYNNAYNWYTNYGGHWSPTDNWDDVQVGDIVVFGAVSPGHVAVVESKSGNSAVLSAFNNPGAGYKHLSLGLLPWTAYGNFVGPSYTWGDTDGKWRGFLINHIDPILSDGGGSSGNTWTVKYRNAYVCGIGDSSGTFKDSSGNQDQPLAPMVIHYGSSVRNNERWEPFNSYTDERTLTYNENGELVATNWEIKYQGSENFELNNQPEVKAGWNLEW